MIGAGGRMETIKCLDTDCRITWHYGRGQFRIRPAAQRWYTQVIVLKNKNKRNENEAFLVSVI